jgi:hypothetical protein
MLTVISCVSQAGCHVNLSTSTNCNLSVYVRRQQCLGIPHCICTATRTQPPLYSTHRPPQYKQCQWPMHIPQFQLHDNEQHTAKQSIHRAETTHSALPSAIPYVRTYCRVIRLPFVRSRQGIIAVLFSYMFSFWLLHVVSRAQR